MKKNKTAAIICAVTLLLSETVSDAGGFLSSGIFADDSSDKLPVTASEAEPAVPVVFDEETVSLPENPEFIFSQPDKAGYFKDDGCTLMYSFSLNNFRGGSKEFSYAAIGVNLPEGFKVTKCSAEKLPTDSDMYEIRYAESGSAECTVLDAQSGSSANGGYVVFAIDDPDCFNSTVKQSLTLEINVPKDTKKYVNTVSFSELYGVYKNETGNPENGTAVPHVSLYTGADDSKLYSVAESVCCTGLRGDVNLDGKVTQDDATVILKENLSQSVSGKSVLGQYLKSSDKYSEKLSYLLGKFSSGAVNEFDQTDATMILRAVLAADMAGKDEITDDICDSADGSDIPHISVLWHGNDVIENNKIVFKGISEDTDVLYITFRVKEDAVKGKYPIEWIQDNERVSSSFCNEDVGDIDTVFCSGVIGINEEVPETVSGDECSFVIGSASAKPGETVTVTCSLKNIPEKIAAFNTYLTYDDTVLEPVSVTPSESLFKSGEFTCAF